MPTKTIHIRTMEVSRCVKEISYHGVIWWKEAKRAKIFLSLFIFLGIVNV